MFFDWFPENFSTYGTAIDELFYWILGITGVVFVATEFLLFWFLFRYRARPGGRARYTHGSLVAEIVWTIIPALILVVLAFYAQRVWSDIRDHPPKDPFVLRVTARQFQWKILYPGPDKEFGTTDDFESLNQMHVPMGRAILVELRSEDVIHSFFLPNFRVKQDAVPGIVSRVWFEPMKTGEWEIACAELCGHGHYSMRGFLTVESPEAFDAWYKTSMENR